MKKKSKKLLSVTICGSMLLGAMGVLFFANNGLPAAFRKVNSENCSHVGNHYEELAPTYTEDGYKEFWTCCKCNETFIEETAGTWGDEGTMIGGVPEVAFEHAFGDDIEEFVEILDTLPSSSEIKLLPDDSSKAIAALKVNVGNRAFDKLSKYAKEFLEDEMTETYEKYTSIKDTMSEYAEIIFGKDENDILTAFNDSAKQHVVNIEYVEDSVYSNKYKITFAESAGAAAYEFLLNNLDVDVTYDSIMSFGIQHFYNWGALSENANQMRLINAPGILVNINVPGVLKDGYDWMPIQYTLPEKPLNLSIFRFGFQETWGHDVGLNEIYFTPLIGIKNPDGPDPEQADLVMEAIENLPTVYELLENDLTVISTKDEFTDVQKAYEGLNDATKELVINADKLEDVAEIYGTYSILNETYVKSDGDDALTLATINESSDISHGLAYDISLRPTTDVANKVMGVKFQTAVKYKQDTTRTFMYVYNPGNDYSLGFGSSFWGAEVGKTTCVGGQWTKVEVNGVFSKSLTYLCYGSLATPSAISGWKFTPVYTTTLSEEPKALLLESKIKDLPDSADVDASLLINQEGLYGAITLENEYQSLSEGGKALVTSYSKLKDINDIFAEKFINIKDCSTYHSNTKAGNNVYGLAAREVVESGNYAVLKKANWEGYDVCTIVFENNTDLNIKTFAQYNSTWGNFFSVNVDSGATSEFSFKISDLPEGATELYLYSDAGLQITSIYGTQLKTFSQMF